MCNISQGRIDLHTDLLFARLNTHVTGRFSTRTREPGVQATTRGKISELTSILTQHSDGGGTPVCAFTITVIHFQILLCSSQTFYRLRNFYWILSQGFHLRMLLHPKIFRTQLEWTGVWPYRVTQALAAIRGD